MADPDIDNMVQTLRDPMCGAIGVIPPASDAILWRYMSFTKFVALLNSRSMYFCRADRFDDPFEGSFPREILDRLKTAMWTGSSMGDLTQADAFSRLRQQAFINCWHMSEHESAAMWKLYGPTGDTIAIRTRAIDLLQSISLKHSLFMGQCYYIDFDSGKGFPPLPSFIEPLFFKRKSFEHEKEVRIVAYVPEWRTSGMLSPPNEFGWNVRVDIGRLIREVIVAPFAPRWFLELLKDVATLYGLPAESVSCSTIEAAPVYA